MVDKPDSPVPVVHVRGDSAIRRPLIILAVCAVAAVGYVARDFLIPTAGAVVLALILTPVANTLERIHLPPTPAAVVSVLLLALVVAGILSLAFPRSPTGRRRRRYLTLTLQRKLEGLRKSLAFMQELTSRSSRRRSASAARSSETAGEGRGQQPFPARPTRQHDAGRDPADRLCRRAGLHAAGASQRPSPPDPAHARATSPRACGSPA